MIYGKGAKGMLIDITDDITDMNMEITLIATDESVMSVKIGDIIDLLNNFIIKVYFDEEIYNIEKNICIDLINIGINEDYIIINDKKYFSIYNKQFGILKRKCQYTLDRFIITNTIDKDINKILLKSMVNEILNEIIKLQENNYVHCDIKADNIMYCDKKFKLIDWDLAVHTNEYTKEEICRNSYIGSATHTSNILELSVDKLCKKFMDRYKQSLKRLASKAIKKRNIGFNTNNINEFTKIHLLDDSRASLESLYKYHIDLYSFSVVLYEILSEDMNPLLINNFTNILQNTINVELKDEYIFQYISLDFFKNMKLNEISLSNLLNLIPDNFYIILK
jgi:serine/threonine protein kinase